MKKLNCIITYQKSNGEIFIRPYNHSAFSLGKRVGDESSMGWKILDIHYKHGDNYYCYEDFMRIFRNELQKELKENKKKKLIKFAIKKLNSMI